MGMWSNDIKKEKTMLDLQMTQELEILPVHHAAMSDLEAVASVYVL